MSPVKVYEKDYTCVLACVPVKMAQKLVELGFKDDVDTLRYNATHIFQDDLLYLMDIPMEDLTKALATIEYTFNGYPVMYAGMDDDQALSHFKHIIVQVLHARQEVNL